MIDFSLIFLCVLVGLFSQLIDGGIGMGYGVISNSFLLGLGIPPAYASASVHTAEICSTAASGVSHLKLGNVDKGLVKRLMFSGILCGAFGAYVCSSINGDVIKPFIAFYLLIMGVFILIRVFKPVKWYLRERNIPFIGGIAGFFDAIGGGGWGPIATTTLVSGGHNPKLTVGSVNLTEFFVTLAEAGTFFVMLGLTHLSAVLGLIIGGVTIAPFAATICKRMSKRLLMFFVGCLVISLSIRTFLLCVI